MIVPTFYRVLRTRRVAIAAAMLASLVLSPVSADAQPHDHAAVATERPLFRSREASGTAWVPDETPMYAISSNWGRWQIMLHGTAFVQMLYESGDRHRTGGFSSHQGSSVNWGMVMARRAVGAGQLGLRTMLSAEPWTVPDCGFINLLASGEMCQGDTIHDRQHPHDMVMELAADYERPLGRSLRWQLYGGLSGEPALGPIGFPHRMSAMSNPIAPITHHWLDSSHIAFGLITAGLYDERWKAEVSVFNGREPDDSRADLDLAPLDSVSGRLSFAPTPRLVLQVSAAHLEEAEAEFPPSPRSDLTRGTASATYQRQVSESSTWSSLLAYGVNAGSEVIPGAAVDLVTHAVLLESSLSVRDRHTMFGRLEVVGKPGHDLHVHESPARVFTVGKFEAGYTRHFGGWKGLVPGVGGVLSVNMVPSELASRYSGRVALGAGAFMVIRPQRHTRH